MKKTIKIEDIKNSKGKTDWNHLKSEEESLVVDPESLPLTQHEVGQLKPLNKSKQSERF